MIERGERGNHAEGAEETVKTCVFRDYDLNKNIAPWVKQKLAVRKVIIGPGVARIGACSFANCMELNTVEFQHSFVWEIGWGAFLNCRNLYSFSIPVNVKRIGTIAFANCSSLRSVSIPSLTRVEDQAFMSCTNLNLIEIGENAMLGKAVFASEVVEDGVTKHKPYQGEIRNLPRNINTDNCALYGLGKEAVAICLKKSEPYKLNNQMSLVDTDIPEAYIIRNDTYALIIGNEHYRFVADVPFAKNDAFGLTSGLPSTLRRVVPTGYIFGLDHFGASAPYKVLDEKFGFTPQQVANLILDVLKQ